MIVDNKIITYGALKMVADINMKTTKKEMLDAINELKSELQKKEEFKLDAEKIKEHTEIKETIKKAEVTVSSDAQNLIAQLKTKINKELNNLSEKITAESENYKNIVKSIEIKQKELQNIFGLEGKASEFAVLIETQNRKREQFEIEIAERKTALNTEISQVKLSWETEKQNYVIKVKEEKEKIDKEHKREKEEYEYSLKRNREIEKNKYKDDLEKLQKELKNKKDDFDSYYSVKSSELKSREESIAAKEEDTANLQQQVDNFPKILEEKINSIKLETENRLNSDFNKNKELLLKGFEGEKNVFVAKISSLDATVKEYVKTIDKLSIQHEQAYQKIQDIANKAIAGASERPMHFSVKSNMHDEK